MFPDINSFFAPILIFFINTLEIDQVFYNIWNREFFIIDCDTKFEYKEIHVEVL